jgi:hypothetical protein
MRILAAGQIQPSIYPEELLRRPVDRKPALAAISFSCANCYLLLFANCYLGALGSGGQFAGTPW